MNQKILKRTLEKTTENLEGLEEFSKNVSGPLKKELDQKAIKLDDKLNLDFLDLILK